MSQSEGNFSVSERVNHYVDFKESGTVIHRLRQEDPRHPNLAVWCTACGCAHVFKDKGNKPIWSFDGNMEKPTVTPSLKVTGGKHGNEFVCHFHVKEGRIEYCGDCTHKLAGKVLPLEAF